MLERKYYPINEHSARIAHEMMSFRDYTENEKTEEYKAEVDSTYELAEKVAERRPSELDRIQWLADSYSKKMADYYNREISIGMMCPSVMISGAGNFPVRKKERQIAAWNSNRENYNQIQKIKDKLESIGNGSATIFSNDEKAIEKLEDKLNSLQTLQEKMKEANKAVRLKDTEEGNDRLREMGYSEEAIQELRAPDFCGRVGYPAYLLSNNNQEIHRIKGRLEELKRLKEKETTEKEYEGFKAVENTEIMRYQIVFDNIPAPEVRSLLKENGFKWAPSQGAWQRQITGNGKWAYNRVVEELQKICG